MQNTNTEESGAEDLVPVSQAGCARREMRAVAVIESLNFVLGMLRNAVRRLDKRRLEVISGIPFDSGRVRLPLAKSGGPRGRMFPDAVSNFEELRDMRVTGEEEVALAVVSEIVRRERSRDGLSIGELVRLRVTIVEHDNGGDRARDDEFLAVAGDGDTVGKVDPVGGGGVLDLIVGQQLDVRYPRGRELKEVLQESQFVEPRVHADGPSVVVGGVEGSGRGSDDGVGAVQARVLDGTDVLGLVGSRFGEVEDIDDAGLDVQVCDENHSFLGGGSRPNFNTQRMEALAFGHANQVNGYRLVVAILVVYDPKGSLRPGVNEDSLIDESDDDDSV